MTWPLSAFAAVSACPLIQGGTLWLMRLVSSRLRLSRRGRSSWRAGSAVFSGIPANCTSVSPPRCPWIRGWRSVLAPVRLRL